MFLWHVSEQRWRHFPYTGIIWEYGYFAEGLRKGWDLNHKFGSATFKVWTVFVLSFMVKVNRWICGRTIRTLLAGHSRCICASFLSRWFPWPWANVSWTPCVSASLFLSVYVRLSILWLVAMDSTLREQGVLLSFSSSFAFDSPVLLFESVVLALMQNG